MDAQSLQGFVQGKEHKNLSHGSNDGVIRQATFKTQHRAVADKEKTFRGPIQRRCNLAT
jgi:hypothetical protein